MKIIADSHIPYVQAYFGSYGELILKPGRQIIAADVKQADMILVRSVTSVNQSLLANSKIKFVGSVAAGADHLDISWLDKAGITWAMAAGFNAPPVADYVMCVVAALQRKQLLSQYGAKVAVIGVGHVGKLVVDRLNFLGYRTILCDPLRAKQEPDFLHQSLEDILDVDLICLHVPLTQAGEYATYHMIDEAFLKRQKPGCILLNASRGAVIDSAALILHGAHLLWCLDVWEHEPQIDKEILARAIIATPHIAGHSIQGKIRGIDMIYQKACELGIIASQPTAPILMPKQQLQFAGREHHWQDIVMGIFNPLVMTALMRSSLLPSDQVGAAFDQMRDKFNYRHEFAYTKVVYEDMLETDRKVLEGLSISGS